MRPIPAAAAALTLLCACEGGYSPGTTGIADGSVFPPIGGFSVDAGADGGLDAGLDAGLDGGLDGGLDAGLDGGLDAGCVAGFQGYAHNHCASSPIEPINLVVNPDCSASFLLNLSGTTCVGRVAGSANVFSGKCNNNPCTADGGLPGIVTCGTQIGTCTINVCDGGTCP